MVLLRSKLKAFSIHLILSCLIIGGFLFFIKQVWYPGTLFELEQTWDGLKILVPVDAILGPLMTLFLYAPHKKNLKIDLSIIAVIQFSALVYGAYVIYTQRPVIFTFNIKEFEVITAAEIIYEKIPEDVLAQLNNERILLTYAKPPKDNDEIIHFLTNNILFQNDPTRFAPITQYADQIKKSSILIETFENENSDRNEKLTWLKNQMKNNNNIYLFHLRGSLGNYTHVAIDINKAKIIAILDIE